MEKITRPGGDGLFILSDDDLPSLNVSFTDFRYGTSRAKSAVLRLFTGAETEDVPKVTVHLNVKADQIDANHMMLRIIRDTKNRHPKRTRINFSFRDLAEDIAVSDEEDLPFGFTERTSDEDDDWSRFFDTDSEYPDEDEDRDSMPGLVFEALMKAAEEHPDRALYGSNILELLKRLTSRDVAGKLENIMSDVGELDPNQRVKTKSVFTHLCKYGF